MKPRLAVELIPGGVVINGQTWIGELSSQELRSVLGQPTRNDIKLAGGDPWRVFEYYDEYGIHTLHEIATKRAVLIVISLIPTRGVLTPTSPFRGELIVNEKQLFAGMKLRELPLKGSLNFVKGIGSTWRCAHDNGYTALHLQKIAWPNGGKSSAPVLVSVTHSFLQN